MKTNLPAATKLALALAGTFALVGCGTVIPKELPQAPTRDALMASYKAAFPEDPAWNSPPVRVDGEVGIVLVEPPKAPVEVSNRRVVIELNYGATYRDLVFMLSTQGIAVSGATELLDLQLPITQWRGRLGSYLTALSGASDIHFLWRGTAYAMDRTDRYVVSAVQDSDYLDTVSSDLSSLGLTAQKSSSAGMIIVNAKPSEARLMRTYLSRAAKNAAVVSLQVGVINVQLTGSRKTGVDWNKLSLVMGENAAAGLNFDLNSVAAASAPGKWQALFTGPTAGLKYAGKNFTLSGVVNFLSSYGDTQTLQNTLLSTVAGKEVNLTSAVNVPYVSSIGVSTSSTTATTTTTGSTSSSTTPVGTATTATAKSGVTVKMKPRYDHDASLVSLDLNLQVSAVLGQNQLSAGNQLGQLTQPTTQDQTFNATLRLRPGETAVVGGVRYLSRGKNAIGPALDNVPLAMNDSTSSVNEMFIVVRPTVRIAGKSLEVENAAE